MKLSHVCSAISAVTLGLPLWVGTAQAGDQYQCTIVEEPAAALDTTLVNITDFHLMKPGNKLKVLPSKNGGEGMVTQLILKNVDCAAEGNDGGNTGKCGVAGQPVTAVLDLSVRQFITAPFDLMHTAGVPLNIEKGKVTFQATGTNKVTGNAVFPLTIGLILNTKMGFDVSIIRTAGSVMSDCTLTPAGPGCLDGDDFAMTGILLGP